MALLHLVLLSLVAVAQAQLFPVGKEVVYNYQAVVSTTVEQPVPYTSQYVINAHVHVKGYNNGSNISLQNVKYKTYVGKYEKMDVKIKPDTIPEDAKCMELPFFVEHGVDGKTKSILLQEQDKVWSMNIKKAIASLLQLDYLQIDLTQMSPYSFYSEEQGVYGLCKLQYDVVKHNITNLTIKKWVHSCKDNKMRLSSNILTPGHCEVKMEPYIHNTSYRTYEIEHNDKMFLINKLESDGSILFSPVISNGAYQVHVKQVMQKMTIGVNDDAEHHTHDMVHHDLRAPLHVESKNVGSIADSTLGRSKDNLEKLMPKMRETLRKIVEHMKDSHVTLSEPDMKRGQLFYEVINQLRYFNIQSIKHCYQILCDQKSNDEEEMLDIFLQILPHVGTHASSIFIRNIVKSKKVDDKIAIQLLSELPFHVLNADESLLKEFVDMIKWDQDLSEQVKVSAILCYSTLLSKALKSYPENIYLNGQVDSMIDEFKSCSSYYCQMVCMSAMQNIESIQVSKFLEPMVTNYKTTGNAEVPHLRNLAIWASKHEHIKHPDMASKIYWPLLINNREPLEIRASALNILMENPSMHHFLKIYWYMQSQNDKHLYSIYYTTIKSLASTVSPCYQITCAHAKKILLYIRVPANVSIESYVTQYDYYDPSYNMGSVVKMSQIGNIVEHGSTAFYLQFSSHLSNLMVNRYSIYVKVIMNNNLHNMIKSKSKTSKNLLELYNEIIKSNNLAPGDFKVECIVLKGNHITSVKYYDNVSSLKNIWEDIIDLHPNQKKYSYSINQHVEGKMLVPTDIGLPAVVFVQLPSVQKLKLYYKTESTTPNIMNMKLQVDMTLWNTQMYGINIYNPIANIWHGSRRWMNTDSHIPLSLDITINTQQKSAKLSIGSVEDVHPTSKHIGFQSYVLSQVYVYDQNTYQYDQIEKVTKGDKYLMKKVIWEKHHEDTGMHYKMTVYDCERQIHPSILDQLMRQITSDVNKNWGNHPMLKYVLAARNLWAYVSLSGHPGMCGIGVQISPSDKYPTTHADLSMRIVTEELPTESDIAPAMKWNFRSTYNLKNEDTLRKSLDLNVKADIFGMHISDLSVNLTTSKPDMNDYKVCISGKHLWEDESMSSKWKLWAGDAVDNKCPQDKSKIEVSVKGGLSDEQKKWLMTRVQDHPECQLDDANYPIPCIMAQTSLRHYEYNIQHYNLPAEYKNMWVHIKDWLRMHYAYLYTRSFDEDRKTEEGQIKVTIDYPITDPSVNMHIDSHYESCSYEGIPLTNWYWTELVQPYSTHVSSITLMKHNLGLTHPCEIGMDHYVNQFKYHMSHVVPEEWVLYAANHKEKQNWEVYIKKMSDKKSLAVRVVVGKDHIDIYDQGIDFQFVLNDKSLPSMEYGYRTSSWFQYKVLKHEHKVYLHTPSVGLNIDYNGSLVTVQIPRSINNEGLCYGIHV